ncbi:MAG: CPBP family intramembrane metalloprotease [Lachnospiraceae bacterium]|nr:CPBP family intramembrane metalloprotease [Lachnospiraceae bacterium]
MIDWNKEITLDDEKGIKRFIVAMGLTAWLVYLLPNLLDYVWNIKLWRVLQGVIRIIIVLPAVWAYKKSGRKIKDLLTIGSWKYYARAMAVALFFLVAFTVIPFLSKMDEMKNVFVLPLSMTWYVIIIYIFFTAPTEEFIYRGYMLETFKGWFDKKPFLAPLFAGIVFGLMHFGGGLYSMVLTTVIGCTWSFLRYYNVCNFMSIVVAHGLYNTMIFLFNYFARVLLIRYS